MADSVIVIHVSVGVRAAPSSTATDDRPTDAIAVTGVIPTFSLSHFENIGVHGTVAVREIKPGGNHGTTLPRQRTPCPTNLTPLLT